MASQNILSNPKASSPTSDSTADFGRAIERLIESVALLQNAATRALPRRYSFRIETTNAAPTGLVIVDSKTKMKATIPLEWTSL